MACTSRTRGRSRSTASPCTSRRRPTPSTAGIGMVHQHFMLADNFTVLENIVLGAEPTTGGVLDTRAARRKIMRDFRRLRPRRRAGRARRELWASATGSASRSARCSTAARRSSSSTSPPPCSSRMRWTSCSTTCASSRPRASPCCSSRTSSTRCSRSPTRSPSSAAAQRSRTVDPKNTTARQLAELMVGSELPVPELRESTVTDVAELTVEGPDRHRRGRPARPRGHQLRHPQGRDRRHRRRRGQRAGRARRSDPRPPVAVEPGASDSATAT